MTSSNGNTFRVTGPLCGEFTGPGEFPTQRPVTRSFDVFFICVWINDWVNNREAGDLRRHRGHYDVNVMYKTTLFVTEVGFSNFHHDDVIKWKHFSVAGPLCGELSGHRRIPHTKARALMFSLICAWINNREAGDLRRRRAHYDVTVMLSDAQFF